MKAKVFLVNFSNNFFHSCHPDLIPGIQTLFLSSRPYSCHPERSRSMNTMRLQTKCRIKHVDANNAE